MAPIGRVEHSAVDVIRKTPDDNRVRPNLTDYEHARARFHWSDVPALCEGMEQGTCNIAYAAVDRHSVGRSGDTYCATVRR